MTPIDFFITLLGFIALFLTGMAMSVSDNTKLKTLMVIITIVYCWIFLLLSISFYGDVVIDNM